MPAEGRDKPVAPPEHVRTTWEQVHAVLSLPLLTEASSPKGPKDWELPPLWGCCQCRAARGTSRGPVTFSIVASLVTSYTTQTTLACKRKTLEGVSRRQPEPQHALMEPRAGPTAGQLWLRAGSSGQARVSAHTYTQPSDCDNNVSSVTGCLGQGPAPLLQELLPASLTPQFPAPTPCCPPTMAWPSSPPLPVQAALTLMLYFKQTGGITGPFRREFSANPEDTQGFRQDFLEPF